ncbi:hypothetical protein SODALDRAFT_332993 [Sodiomyces alkalinus F11]|uniref:Uncharacterized protein n=1 Tax=Sodiomyces alkalinus (strain CBS 110278 / VKM F-3762 / F11) TaxID=1314773 RepID=A0A3N2PV84_SODAK|nr:hypothetical protein SODALDRAFT_332993 [Sodiomyces alkalinus F11]ROT38423.1 hypothetical protein SODALDRAFT_332993 [Sodiomyces alkalinus F11]
MPSFFFNATVLQAKSYLQTLRHLINKAEVHAKATNTPWAVFTKASLAPDMHGLPFQVHAATDAAQRLVSRVRGVEPLDLKHDEEGLDTADLLGARIDQVLALLEEAAADPAGYDAGQDKVVAFNLGPDISLEAPVRDYALGFSMPTVAFHVNATFAILRNRGVQVGKLDYILPFITENLPQYQEKYGQK